MTIRYADIPLLSVRACDAKGLAPLARRLGRRAGLDVRGVNELVWPSGAANRGGMIGLIEEARVGTLRDAWTAWRTGDGANLSDLPLLTFHDAPALHAAVAAIEPVDAATGGLFLVALVDARISLAGGTFAGVSAASFVDWETALTAAVESVGLEAVLSYAIADRLTPEIDDVDVLSMGFGEWLDAAAWSVGGRWRLTTTGALELQSPSQAADAESANRAGPILPLAGRFDVEPTLPAASLRLTVRQAYGAVPRARGESTFSATASPPIGVGFDWRARTTAFWERTPVDSSQDNAPELQQLAEDLLADAQGWTRAPSRVELAGFAAWTPGARDRTVRWIDGGGERCRTIVETVSTDDLPSRLVHRSALVPREASLTEAIADQSGAGDTFFLATLAAAPGRPARQVRAWYPPFPAGGAVSANDRIWLDYDRSSGQWILVPWTTSS